MSCLQERCVQLQCKESIVFIVYLLLNFSYFQALQSIVEAKYKKAIEDNAQLHECQQ